MVFCCLFVVLVHISVARVTTQHEDKSSADSVLTGRFLKRKFCNNEIIYFIIEDSDFNY